MYLSCSNYYVKTLGITSFQSFIKIISVIFQAIDQLENCRLANEEEERSMEKKCIPLYLNASLAALRYGNWKSAANFSRKV